MPAYSNVASSLDPLLTEFAVDWVDANKGSFVAPMVSAVSKVGVSQGHYPKLDNTSARSDFFAPRVPGEESVGQRVVSSPDTYYCKQYGGHFDVPLNDIRAQSRIGGLPGLERSAVGRTMNSALLKLEGLLAGKIAASTWTTNYQGVAAAPGANQFLQWDNASANPVKDIRNLKTEMSKLTGATFAPNTLVIADDVLTTLLTANAEIKDRIKYTSATIDLATLAALFDLKQILPMKATKATNSVGDTLAGSLLLSKKALLCYVNLGAGMYDPTALRTFAIDGDGMANGGVRAWSYVIEELEVMRYEGEVNVDMKVVDASLGAYLYDVIA